MRRDPASSCLSRSRALAGTVVLALAGWFAGPVAVAAPYVRLKAVYTGAAPAWTTGEPGSLKCRPLVPGPVDFSKVPDALDLSYLSFSPSQQSTAGLGDFVRSARAGGYVDRVEAVLVTWAKASQWPAWSSLNPDGYVHRVTAGIFEKITAGTGTTFRLVVESGAWVQVPWRPLVMADGSPYPFNGYAFKVVIPFPEGVALPAEYAVLISYNTSKSGYQPLAAAGPYDSLNFALSEAPPVVGSDLDGDAVLWVKPGSWSYPSTNWGGFGTPMTKVVMRPGQAPEGVRDQLPVDAGSYHLFGGSVPGNEAFAVIEPAVATVILDGLVTSKGRAFPGPVVTTVPSGLPWVVSYGGTNAPPTAVGTHPIEVTISDRNHTGAARGVVTVTGPTFADWLATHPGVEQAGWEDDPDGDGLCNLIEYATGSDPGRTSPNPLRALGAGGWRVSRLKSLPDCEFAVEESGDLGVWQEVAVLPAGATGDTEECTVPPSSGDPGERRFLRLRISPLAGALSTAGGGPGE